LDKVHAATVPAGSPSAPATDTADSSSTPANSGSSKIFTPDPICYNFVSDLNNKKSKSYFLNSSKPIPELIEPIKTDMAMELVSELISDLNEKFLTELSLPTEEEEFEDTACDSNDICSEMKFIVLGGSHASRLAASLDDMDLDVVDLSTPCWSLSEASVHKLAAQLETVVNEDTEHKLVVIYHLFDNGIFYGVQQDGTGTRPF
jgi:hypothetical protein